jgi:hypothetical protein
MANSGTFDGLTSTQLIQILRLASLDDNPLSGTDVLEELAFEPALVDFMHATADYLEVARNTIGLDAALGLAVANFAFVQLAVQTEAAAAGQSKSV